ncbi:MAG: hypothetical protein JW709_08930 [Sedimentisphaerales bacterium]|nr:hypothetical protein [Sedimentisphaerales bacterium]
MAKAELSKDEINTLYIDANHQFRQANEAVDSEQAKRYYQKAILGFERIINEGDVHNPKLYYNLANAYLLRGQPGGAILNYRRAQKLDGADENIRKNLAFARSQRIDKITPKPEKRILQTLFFWHYDFSLKTRSLLTCIFWGMACLCITGMLWFGRSTPLKGLAVISGILLFCFLASVLVEYRAFAHDVNGVIITKEVIARQGDGVNYPPSFKEPLHEGTEFYLIEKRPGWLHIRLSDGSDGWIVDDSTDLI